MRRRHAAVLVAPFVGAATALACVDLFHSTDFPTLCAQDASRDVCAPPAPPQPPGPDADSEASADAKIEASRPPTDFCLWTSTEARQRAEHACAWLGACADPLGANVLGECMFNALQVYDCRVSPNRLVRPGATHDYWDCLWQATTCDAVRACIAPSIPPCKSGPGTRCASPTVRVLCDSQGAHPRAIESCVATGKVCTEITSTTAACTGTNGGSCVATRCDGTQMHLCADGGVDDGVDCAMFGAGTCAANGRACKPSGTDCAESVATCNDAGVIRGCPALVDQSTDCRALSLGKCSDNEPGQVDDLARACKAPDAGTCPTDSCAGPSITSCYRGNTFTLSCGDQSLDQCNTFLVEGLRGACRRR